MNARTLREDIIKAGLVLDEDQFGDTVTVATGAEDASFVVKIGRVRAEIELHVWDASGGLKEETWIADVALKSELVIAVIEAYDDSVFPDSGFDF